jgi:hypothetical protein
MLSEKEKNKMIERAKRILNCLIERMLSEKMMAK